MPSSEDILQDYIKHLLDMQDEHSSWLSEDDLRRAARELGLSESDLARIEQRAHACMQRGDGFFGHGSWTDAIAEYRQVAALRPLDVEGVYKLARAYHERWKTTGEEQDLEQAERYARRCVHLDPSFGPAYELLSSLRDRRVGRGRTRVPSRVAMFGGGAVLLVLAGALLVLVTRSRLSAYQAPTPTVETPTPDSPALPGKPSGAMADSLPSVSGPGNTGTVLGPDGELPAEWEVPVHLMTERAEGLTLDVQRSLMKTYEGFSYSYTLHATLHSSGEEVHRLRMRMVWVGPSGETLDTHYFDAYEDFRPPARPGEAMFLDFLEFEEKEPPRLAEVRLHVDIIERWPAPDRYEDMRPLDPTWEIDNPSLEFRMWERESRISESALLGTWSHRLVLLVHNTGGRAIEGLEVRVEWLDSQGDVIASDEAYLVPPVGPVLLPGQRRAELVIHSFPNEQARFDAYRVVVIDAE